MSRHVGGERRGTPPFTRTRSPGMYGTDRTSLRVGEGVRSLRWRQLLRYPGSRGRGPAMGHCGWGLGPAPRWKGNKVESLNGLRVPTETGQPHGAEGWDEGRRQWTQPQNSGDSSQSSSADRVLDECPLTRPDRTPGLPLSLRSQTPCPPDTSGKGRGSGHPRPLPQGDRGGTSKGGRGVTGTGPSLKCGKVHPECSDSPHGS